MNDEKKANGKSSNNKGLEVKNTSNPTKIGQQQFLFHSKVHTEFEGVEMGVLESGVPYLSQRGIVKMTGIARTPFQRLTNNWLGEKSTSTKGIGINQILKKYGYNEDELFIEVEVDGKKVYAYTELVCNAILEYYAFEAPKRSKQALDNYRILSRAGFRLFIYQATGYNPQTEQLDKWKYFHDRVDLNYDTVPQGYFSIFKEISNLIVTLIRGNVIVDDRTIPDISVGLVWAKFWQKNNFDGKYGDRIRYEHNYPQYYPQSVSNPQEPWAYPDEALAYFREWFRNEYIIKKFPNYLLSKVKNSVITVQDSQKVLEAVQPKQITQNKQDNPTSAQFIKNIQADDVDISEDNKFEVNIKKMINYKGKTSS